MLAIAKAVRRSSIRCQFLFLTGRNLAVLRKLTGGAFDHRIVAIPFTSSFGHYLNMSDVVMGKPGSVTISQAVAAGRPLVVDQNEGDFAA